MKSTKNQTIRFRVDKETKAILDSNVAASGMRSSEFLRQLIRNGTVKPMTNGKEIARQVGMLHEDMRVYRDDMVERVQALQDAVEENNSLLQRQGCQLFDRPAIREVIEAQRMRMDTIIKTMMAAYDEKERSVEESLHNILGDIGSIGG